MSKLIKLSRNFIIMGIVLMIIAVIMNDGKIPLFANHYEEKHYVKLADNIKSINIDAINDDVTVEPNDSDNIEISYYDSHISQYKITDNDSTLTIKEQDDNILKLNFNFIIKRKNLIIKVPKKSIPELELRNTVGNVKLSDLNLTNVKITSNVGNIKLEKLNITNLFIENTAGNTVVANINSEDGEFNINSESGNIYITTLNNFNIANIKNAFGDVSLNDSSSTKFNIDSSTGNIYINELNNSVESISCKISTGNINAKNINASKLISLEARFGNIYADISDKEDNYSSSGNTYYSKSGAKIILVKTEYGDTRTNFIN
ncbi:DUF4097 family beta strand repeat-containing protein [Gemella sanguinis]|uniref:DUF4097 family beta strand repeat-containing protein n=1 Tax=Gemella sanguinis TaxID=84135 RepID=UPI00352C40AD